MSQPIPERAPQRIVFLVPISLGAILIGGGCGAYHTAQTGAVHCAACYPNAPAFVEAIEPTSTPEPAPAAADITETITDPAPAKARKTQPTE